MATSKYEVQIANLSTRIQELRQVRHAASHPFFDKSAPLSRIQRICEERERLAKSKREDWRICSFESINSHEKAEMKTEQASELDDQNLSNSYTDIAYMLQSDDYDRFTREELNVTSNYKRQPAASTHTSRLSGQVRQQSNARLQATVQLLAESIEEAANLRAILEYSMDPDKLDSLLNSSLLNDENMSVATHTNTSFIATRSTRKPARSARNGTPGRNNNNNSRGDEAAKVAEQETREFKNRALLLEQGKLVDQLISMKAVLEAERTRRVRAEKDLEISTELLHSTQFECEAMQQQLNESQHYPTNASSPMLTHSLNSPAAHNRSNFMSPSTTSTSTALTTSPPTGRYNTPTKSTAQDNNAHNNISYDNEAAILDLSHTNPHTENLRLPPSGSRHRRSLRSSHNNTSRVAYNNYTDSSTAQGGTKDMNYNMEAPLPEEPPPDDFNDAVVEHKDSKTDILGSIHDASRYRNARKSRHSVRADEDLGTQEADLLAELDGSDSESAQEPEEYSSYDDMNMHSALSGVLPRRTDMQTADSAFGGNRHAQSVVTTVAPHAGSTRLTLSEDRADDNLHAFESTVDADLVLEDLDRSLSEDDAVADSLAFTDIYPGATKSDVAVEADVPSIRDGSDTGNSGYQEEGEMEIESLDDLLELQRSALQDPAYELAQQESVHYHDNLKLRYGDSQSKCSRRQDLLGSRDETPVASHDSTPVALSGSVVHDNMDVASVDYDDVRLSMSARGIAAQDNWSDSSQDNQSLADIDISEPPAEDAFLSSPAAYFGGLSASSVGAGSPDDSGSESPAETALQHQQQQQPQHVVLDIDIGDGEKAEVCIYPHSDPVELTVQFILEHQLPSEYFNPLLDYISQTQKESLLPHLDTPLPHSNFQYLSTADNDDDLSEGSVRSESMEGSEIRDPSDNISAGSEASDSDNSDAEGPAEKVTKLEQATQPESPISSAMLNDTVSTASQVVSNVGISVQTTSPTASPVTSPSTQRDDQTQSKLLEQQRPSPLSPLSPSAALSPRSPYSARSQRSPSTPKDVTVILPTSIPNITVALPGNISDLTLTVPSSVQNITVTMPAKLKASTRSPMVFAADEYAAAAAVVISPSHMKSSSDSPMSRFGLPSPQPTALTEGNTWLTSQTTTPGRRASLSRIDSVAAALLLGAPTAESKAVSPPKPPTKPAALDEAKGSRPLRKRKFFPSALNVLDGVVATQDIAPGITGVLYKDGAGAETESNPAHNDVSALSKQSVDSPVRGPASKMGRSISPKRSQSDESSSLSMDVTDFNGAGHEQSKPLALVASPSQPESSFFASALRVLGPEAVSPKSPLSPTSGSPRSPLAATAAAPRHVSFTATPVVRNGPSVASPVLVNNYLGAVSTSPGTNTQAKSGESPPRSPSNSVDSGSGSSDSAPAEELILEEFDCDLPDDSPLDISTDAPRSTVVENELHAEDSPTREELTEQELRAQHRMELLGCAPRRSFSRPVAGTTFLTAASRLNSDDEALPMESPPEEWRRAQLSPWSVREETCLQQSEPEPDVLSVTSDGRATTTVLQDDVPLSVKPKVASHSLASTAVVSTEADRRASMLGSPVTQSTPDSTSQLSALVIVEDVPLSSQQSVACNNQFTARQSDEGTESNSESDNENDDKERHYDQYPDLDSDSTADEVDLEEFDCGGPAFSGDGSSASDEEGSVSGVPLKEDVVNFAAGFDEVLADGTLSHDSVEALHGQNSVLPPPASEIPASNQDSSSAHSQHRSEAEDVPGDDVQHQMERCTDHSCGGGRSTDHTGETGRSIPSMELASTDGVASSVSPAHQLHSTGNEESVRSNGSLDNTSTHADEDAAQSDEFDYPDEAYSSVVREAHVNYKVNDTSWIMSGDDSAFVPPPPIEDWNPEDDEQYHFAEEILLTDAAAADQCLDESLQEEPAVSDGSQSPSSEGDASVLSVDEFDFLDLDDDIPQMGAATMTLDSFPDGADVTQQDEHGNVESAIRNLSATVSMRPGIFDDSRGNGERTVADGSDDDVHLGLFDHPESKQQDRCVGAECSEDQSQHPSDGGPLDFADDASSPGDQLSEPDSMHLSRVENGDDDHAGSGQNAQEPSGTFPPRSVHDDEHGVEDDHDGETAYLSDDGVPPLPAEQFEVDHHHLELFADTETAGDIHHADSTTQRYDDGGDFSQEEERGTEELGEMQDGYLSQGTPLVVDERDVFGGSDDDSSVHIDGFEDFSVDFNADTFAHQEKLVDSVVLGFDHADADGSALPPPLAYEVDDASAARFYGHVYDDGDLQDENVPLTESAAEEDAQASILSASQQDSEGLHGDADSDVESVHIDGTDYVSDDEVPLQPGDDDVDVGEGSDCGESGSVNFNGESGLSAAGRRDRESSDECSVDGSREGSLASEYLSVTRKSGVESAHIDRVDNASDGEPQHPTAGGAMEPSQTPDDLDSVNGAGINRSDDDNSMCDNLGGAGAQHDDASIHSDDSGSVHIDGYEYADEQLEEMDTCEAELPVKADSIDDQHCPSEDDVSESTPIHLGEFTYAWGDAGEAAAPHTDEVGSDESESVHLEGFVYADDAARDNGGDCSDESSADQPLTPVEETEQFAGTDSDDSASVHLDGYEYADEQAAEHACDNVVLTNHDVLGDIIGSSSEHPDDFNHQSDEVRDESEPPVSETDDFTPPGQDDIDDTGSVHIDGYDYFEDALHSQHDEQAGDLHHSEGAVFPEGPTVDDEGTLGTDVTSLGSVHIDGYEYVDGASSPGSMHGGESDQGGSASDTSAPPSPNLEVSDSGSVHIDDVDYMSEADAMLPPAEEVITEVSVNSGEDSDSDDESLEPPLPTSSSDAGDVRAASGNDTKSCGQIDSFDHFDDDIYISHSSEHAHFQEDLDNDGDYPIPPPDEMEVADDASGSVHIDGYDYSDNEIESLVDVSVYDSLLSAGAEVPEEVPEEVAVPPGDGEDVIDGAAEDSLQLEQAESIADANRSDSESAGPVDDDAEEYVSGYDYHSEDSGSVHLDGYEYADELAKPPVDAEVPGEPLSDEEAQPFRGSEGSEHGSEGSASVHIDDVDYADEFLNFQHEEIVQEDQNGDASEDERLFAEPPAYSASLPEVEGIDYPDDDSASVHLEGFEYTEDTASDTRDGDDADQPLTPVEETERFAGTGSDDSASVHLDGYEYSDEQAPEHGIGIEDVVESLDSDGRESGSAHIDGFDYRDEYPDEHYVSAGDLSDVGPPVPASDEELVSHSDGVDECSDAGSVHLDGYEYADDEALDDPSDGQRSVSDAEHPPAPLVSDDSDASDSVHFDGEYEEEIQQAELGDGGDAEFPAPPSNNDDDSHAVDGEDGSENSASVHIDGFDYQDDDDLLSENEEEGRTEYLCNDTADEHIASHLSDADHGADPEHIDDKEYANDIDGFDHPHDNKASAEDLSDTDPPAPSSDEDLLLYLQDGVDENSDSGSVHLDGYEYADDATLDAEEVDVAEEYLTDAGAESAAEVSVGDDRFPVDDNSDGSRSAHIDGFDYGEEASFDGSVHINDVDYASVDDELPLLSDEDLCESLPADGSGDPSSVHIDVCDYTDDQGFPQGASRELGGGVELHTAAPLDGEIYQFGDGSDDSVHLEGFEYADDELESLCDEQPDVYEHRSDVPDVLMPSAVADVTVGGIKQEDEESVHLDGFEYADSDASDIDGADADELPVPPFHATSSNCTDLGSAHIDDVDYVSDGDEMLPPVEDVTAEVSVDSSEDSDSVHIDGFEYADGDGEEPYHHLHKQYDQYDQYAHGRSDYAPPPPEADWDGDDLSETSEDPHRDTRIITNLNQYLQQGWQGDNFSSPVRRSGDLSERNISSVERIRRYKEVYSTEPPMETSFSNEDMSVLLDVAAEVFDSANELNELGLTTQSLPLYENAIKLLGLTNMDNLQQLREEYVRNMM